MRCLGHLGQWEDLSKLVAIAKTFPEHGDHSSEIAKFELEATLNRGRWEVTNPYLLSSLLPLMSLPLGIPCGCTLIGSTVT